MMPHAHRRILTLCTTLAVWIAAGAAAAASRTPEAADPSGMPGLTAAERAHMQLHRSDEVSQPAGPVHFVAPGIRVLERTGTPPAHALGTRAEVKNFLLRSQPSQTNLTSVLTNGGFEDGNFNGW